MEGLPPEIQSQLKDIGIRLRDEEVERRLENIPGNSKLSYLIIIFSDKSDPPSFKYHEFKSSSRESILWLQKVLSKARLGDRIEVKLGIRE